MPPPDHVAAPAGRAAIVSEQEQEEIERHLQMLGYTE